MNALKSDSFPSEQETAGGKLQYAAYDQTTAITTKGSNKTYVIHMWKIFRYIIMYCEAKFSRQFFCFMSRLFFPIIILGSGSLTLVFLIQPSGVRKYRH
jgi:hypothetical protein